MAGVAVKPIPTTPIEGKKPARLVQKESERVFVRELSRQLGTSLFMALHARGVARGRDSVRRRGDGLTKRRRNHLEIDAEKVKKMYVGQNGPNARRRRQRSFERAKHTAVYRIRVAQPGGPEEDWGIKFNSSAGEPLRKKSPIKSEFTQSVSELPMADIPDVDLSKVGVTKFGDFEVEIVNQRKLWLLKEVFDFDLISKLLKRKDFSIR